MLLQLNLITENCEEEVVVELLSRKDLCDVVSLRHMVLMQIEKRAFLLEKKFVEEPGPMRQYFQAQAKRPSFLEQTNSFFGLSIDTKPKTLQKCMMVNEKVEKQEPGIVFKDVKTDIPQSSKMMQKIFVPTKENLDIFCNAAVRNLDRLLEGKLDLASLTTEDLS